MRTAGASEKDTKEVVFRKAGKFKLLGGGVAGRVNFVSMNLQCLKW